MLEYYNDKSYLNSLPYELNRRLPYRYEIGRDQAEAVYVKERFDRLSAMHFHECLEFIYAVEGEIDITVGEDKLRLSPGQMFAASGFLPHACTSIGSTYSYLCMIPRPIFSGIAPQIGRKAFRRPIINDSDGTLARCFKQMLDMGNGQGCFAGMPKEERKTLLNASAQLFLQIVIAAVGLTDKKNETSLLVQTIDYIRHHFREDLHITDLTRVLLCNQHTLSSQFRATFGLSLNDYIGSVRAAEVKRLLAENPAMTLKEAAALSGFGSLRTLHRVYAQVYGTTPRDSR